MENLQINAPYSYIVKCLDYNNIGYKAYQNYPLAFQPTRKVYTSDKLGYFYTDTKSVSKPICVSMDNKVVDGNYRLLHNKITDPSKKIASFKIMLGHEDALKVLKQIEDQYSKENNVKDEYIKCYREKPVGNSVSGNFFKLETFEGCIEYEIKFDKLFEVSENIIKSNTDFPPMALALKFADMQTLISQAEKHQLPLNAYVVRFVHNVCKKRGYDGIKYGNNLIQTIN